MSSRLETIPRDILQLIAFLSSSSSVFDAPIEIQRLLLTSSYIYQSLHIHAAPHVFAQIFHTKFDTAALFRRYSSSLTHSLLATELSNRCRLLQRARRMDFSPINLMQDLWTALFLIVESDGLNELQLFNSNFPSFILGLARDKLHNSQTTNCRTEQALQHVILLLLCFSLPRQVILDMSKEERDELYGLIYPFIFMPSRKSQSPFQTDQSCPACPASFNDCSCPDPGNSLCHELPTFYTYLGRQVIRFPDTCFAAVNLAFVIHETRQLKVPYHLPENRAIANATQRTGPTKDDYKAMLCYKTPLFADYLTSTDEPSFDFSFDPRRSMSHDLEFGSLLGTSGGAKCLDTFVYTPGTMTGVWEGIYQTVDMPARNMRRSIPINPTTEGGFIKAMQFALTEYICVSSEEQDGALDDDIHAFPFNFFHKQAGGSEITVGSRRYQKYPATASNPNCPECVIIVGQVRNILSYLHITLADTLDDHDQAWSGYRFTGRMHKDGLLVLKREAKTTGSTDGTWFFEGRLHFGSVIVGRWWINHSLDNSLNWRHGIFSLGKVVDKWKEK
ncbi:hypothetical protein BYT27DRAFT_7075863 [Phlegmacium glaucopus]|nr:hypothetical protein BYT27DRAFT_7075863 [Phlegmacium glaucopus]